MFTLGYSFRPWTQAEAIADGPAIWRYIHETARDYGMEEKIRFGHRVVRADGRRRMRAGPCTPSGPTPQSL